MERIITYDVSENFIGRLAEYLEENFLKQGRDIGRLAIVFGGRRPALFLKKALSRKIKKGFLPPRFFSIDEFVEYAFSKKEAFFKITDLEACYSLYRLALERTPEILKGRDSFSQFLPWIREILSFIEQLDLEDIGNEALKNIEAKAEIGYDVPESINSLLRGIVSLREAYHVRLREKNTYSRGLMYSALARSIGKIELEEFDRVFFCGFFYLHKTEEAILKYLYEAEKAVLFFQGDESEWSVLANIAKGLSVSIKPLKKIKPHFDLSIQAGFDTHSQACLVRETVRQIKGPEETVIVLPNPDTMIPLVSETAQWAGEFNISMGYPLKRSSLYSLFACIYRAQETKKDGEYYAKDYLRVLSHPLVKNIKFVRHPSVTRVLVHKIEEILLGAQETSFGGNIFILPVDIQNSREVYELAMKTMKTMDIEVTLDELKETVRQLHQLLFFGWEAATNFFDFSLSLEALMTALLRMSFLGNYPLNLKMAESIMMIKEELQCASFNREPFPKEDIFKIFTNKLENTIISFSGSPLKGLQILGLFETRSLNFDHVIVMDMNESIFPRLKIYEPLIPREVMISLGLNRLEKEEEIQRYQFKRLIASAKRVSLVYQEGPERERSRFVEELIWERQKLHRTLDAMVISQAGFYVGVMPHKVRIKKKSQVLSFLREQQYSASSVNTYMHCPLRFYYQYVLGLKEKEDLLDEPEGSDIGTFIHELLHRAFSRFIEKRPSLDDAFETDFFAEFDEKFSDEFEKKMKSDSFLIKEVMRFRLEQFLEHERKRRPERILCLEETFQTTIKLTEGNFKFKAVVDRIDRMPDEGILIIDYKTGSIQNMPLSDPGRILSAGFQRATLKKTIKSFQLPLYLYLVENTEAYRGLKNNACLYALKETNQDSPLYLLFKKEVQGTEKTGIMAVYLQALDYVLRDIMDPKGSFEADREDAGQCLHCPFVSLCR